MSSVKKFRAQIASSLLFAVIGLGLAEGHELPYPVGLSYAVKQKNNEGTHTGKEAWAYDFVIGDGQPIVATEAGTVKMVKEDSNVYGCSSSFANSGNYVVIDHGNGQSSLYLHLQQNSVVVNKDDKVVKGQRLGKVGNTGWICGSSGGPGTHLHYQLQSTCTSWYCQSVPVLFAPRLRSPAQGATASSRTVKFQWEPILYASVYRIVISQYSDFRGYNDTTRTCDGTCFTTPISGTTSYTKTLNNAHWKYYVRIRASDDTNARGASPWSNSWFTTP